MKANARRNKWPKFQNDDGTFTDEYQKYMDDMSVCYDLVAIARDVLGKPLTLVAGGPRSIPPIVRASTDGKKINLPKMHPQRRIATKHELSHIYFKSNCALRLLFVEDLLRRVEAQSSKSFLPVAKSQVTEDLCFLVNVLDDIRVNSLWGVLYPGDGMDMEDWYYGNVGPDMAKKAADDFGDDISHLTTYMILLCLNQDVNSTEWGEFKEDIIQARDNVYYKSFGASLLIMKKLVLGIAKRLAEKDDEEDDGCSAPAWGGTPDPTDSGWKDDEGGDVVPRDDLDDLMKKRIEEAKKKGVDALQKMASGKLPGKFSDDNAGFDWDTVPARDPKTEKAMKAIVQSLNKINTDDEDDLEDALQAFEDAGISQAQEIKTALSNLQGGNFDTEGEYLKKSVKADVKIKKIKRADIVPTQLSPEDIKAADKWRKHFQRIMGVMATRTEDLGSHLMADLYLQRRLSRLPVPCFSRETTGRGFRLTILVDMSGSMRGDFHRVSRLCAVLQRALNFPFVHLNVMGFNSKRAGTVNMYQYPKNTPGLLSADSSVEGVTPLSHAIQIAGRSMLQHRDENHLFVLSDGFPVYALKKRHGRAVDTNSLVNWTADAVSELTRHRVRTWCFMAGSYTPSGDRMNKMFGLRRWKNIRMDQIYTDSFSFITTQFLRYLRTR